MEEICQGSSLLALTKSRSVSRVTSSDRNQNYEALTPGGASWRFRWRATNELFCRIIHCLGHLVLV